MEIDILNDGEHTLYEQIVQQIMKKIVAKELVEGEQLPSIRTFANNSDVSIITIKRAYEELLQLGFINVIPSKGYYISEQSEDKIHDIAIMSIQNKLVEIVNSAKALNITSEEINILVDVLFEDI